VNDTERLVSVVISLTNSLVMLLKSSFNGLLRLVLCIVMVYFYNTKNNNIMQEVSVSYSQVLNDASMVFNGSGESSFSGILEIPAPTQSRLKDEGGENFYEYLDWLGMTEESDIIVLPLTQHFYYDYDDLKAVKTLINLRRLNLIKNLDEFIGSLKDMLRPGASFIGCFADSKSERYTGLPSKMYKGFLNIIDSRTDTGLDLEDVSRRLEKNGFRLLDMTEFSDLTYFRAESI
jgi:hypothetical protein